MPYGCEEISEGDERYGVILPSCGNKGKSPRILICGPDGARDKTSCYKRDSPYDQQLYQSNVLQGTNINLPSKDISIPMTFGNRYQDPLIGYQDPLIGFQSPLSRYHTLNQGRQNLFSEFRNYQPTHRNLSGNLNLFNLAKTPSLFDDLYSTLNSGSRININPRDRSGNTPLITALLDDNNKAASLLIVKGADVNTSNHAGLTPLMAAASNNNELMVDILLKKGARKGAKTRNGMTVYDFTTDTDIKLLLNRTRSGSAGRSHSKSRKACKAGQVRNRSTGRCRNK